MVFLDSLVDVLGAVFLFLACFHGRSGGDTRDSVARFGEQHGDGVMNRHYPLEPLVMEG